MGQKTYQVRGLTVGAGIPKICVPVCGRTVRQALEETEQAACSEADLVEWRLDYLDALPESGEWREIFHEVREKLGDKPLLVTYRTKREGGAAEYQITEGEYAGLYRSVLVAGEADLLDLEYNLGREAILPLIKAAKEAGVLCVVSYHNFHETPEREFLLSLYREMEEWGGDILKAAVMPADRTDLLRMMEVSLAASGACRQPVIAISMGSLGVESRICAEAVGSAVTFASLNRASAPGQLPAGKLRMILETIHLSGYEREKREFGR